MLEDPLSDVVGLTDIDPKTIEETIDSRRFRRTSHHRIELEAKGAIEIFLERSVSFSCRTNGFVNCFPVWPGVSVLH
jgi:hypothetical protein